MEKHTRSSSSILRASFGSAPRQQRDGSVTKRGDATHANSKYDILRLDNQLCFVLYSATRAITKTYRERLGPMGLTYPQYLVMMVLWEDDELSVTSICERLALDTGTLTPLLKRLEKLKLVSRTRSSNDQRAVIVSVTAAGWRLRDDAVAARRFVACQLEMSEKEILALRRELLNLIGRLESNRTAA